jgi:hypothetical protein
VVREVPSVIGKLRDSGIVDSFPAGGAAGSTRPD